MAFPHSIEQAREDLRKTLSDPTPLYAVVGIADAAAATLRTARADVMSAPGQVRALPSRAQAMVDEALTGAISRYSELAGRGRTFVTRVRNSESTDELEHQAKATVTKVRAATTTTKKSAATTKTRAKSAATTGKRSASTAQSAAKGAATSSRRTAAAAKKAAESTAGKLGT